MVTTEVARDDASRFGVVMVDDDGAVTDYAYKPDEPASTTVTTEVLAFDPELLLSTLEELEAESGDDGLKDLGDHGLPQLVDPGRVRAVPLDGYWRNVGTIDAYWDSHLDLLADEPPFDLHDRSWPVNTQGISGGGARVGEDSRVSRALLSPGCAVYGEVTRSVLPPGVVVHAGALVRDSVMLHGAVIHPGAVVDHCIVDSGVVVADGARPRAGGDVTVVSGDR